jgi:hypothetical protein
MAIYGKLEKICATCIYWKGKRYVDFQYINTNTSEGKCGCDEGFYNIKTTEGSKCSDWKGFACEKDN